MVLKYHGLDVSESELVLLLKTSFRGTLFSAVERASVYGFEVVIREGIPADLLAVTSAGHPLITSVDSLLLPNHPPPGGAHAVVVAGATTHTVAVLDPDRPGEPGAVPYDVFIKAWTQRQRRLAEFLPTDPHGF
jgi:hypothetical protein